MSRPMAIQTRNTLVVACNLTALLAIGAVGPWPYGYYTFLRWSVCVVSVVASIVLFRWGDSIFGAVLVGVGILFNPIRPIYLDRSTWSVIDIAVGVFMFVVASRVLGPKEAKEISDE